MFDLHIFYLLLIFIAAGLVKGVTGMGLPTVAMGLLGLLMPPQAAAALLVLPSLLTNLWQLLAGPALTQIVRRLWLMMTGILIGTLAGSSLLIDLNPRWSALALGAALIVYAAYALCGPVFQVSARVEKWLSPIVGGLTGVITGATGVFVIPAVPWLQALGFRRDELVQALGLSFTLSTLAMAAGLALHDGWHDDAGLLSALALLPALLGMWLGQRIRTRLSPQRFRQGFLLFLLALGVELICRGWLA
ncbi:sulfite exporter TauE/SafE family protein [Klebsiella quasivariicola]|uniref:sulfite exporter TauE/SafE family protein n=1 Tax=Klebsiella quasivariicola TaxID=2026240 RepID=UPI001CCD0026|nr:sulfite exporter TauE/SafE family protein [Klebsiella quasivariicola]MBZ9579680.1 sulfite exporter TauE/SafE family protein [Klebsiella quasivariicola]